MQKALQGLHLPDPVPLESTRGQWSYHPMFLLLRNLPEGLLA
jgi:hypothetical protein